MEPPPGIVAEKWKAEALQYFAVAMFDGSLDALCKSTILAKQREQLRVGFLGHVSSSPVCARSHAWRHRGRWRLACGHQPGVAAANLCRAFFRAACARSLFRSK